VLFRSVELSVEDLPPRAKVELAARHGDDGLATHDRALQVRVGIVLVTVVVVLVVGLLRREPL
jgi:hypothetical protein